jgi:hypothetical protein
MEKKLEGMEENLRKSGRERHLSGRISREWEPEMTMPCTS